MKINLFLDCEFNGFNGELISMALVSEHGDEFYEACDKVAEWYEEQAKQYRDRTHWQLDYYKEK